MKLVDNILWFLSFGTRVSPKPKVETPKKIENKEAEKLALRLIKSRERFKALKVEAIKAIDDKNSVIDLLSTYLLAAVAKNDGSMLIQKDILETMKANLATLGIKTIPVEDSPGDVTLKIVDRAKELQDLQKKFAEAAQTEMKNNNEE